MKIRSSLLACALIALAPAAARANDEHRAKDIVDTAVEAGSFQTLAAALQAAELVDALKGEGPFTVFAPTDEAFAKLPEETLKALLRPENRAQLVSVLTYHVVPGAVAASDAVAAKRAKTLQDEAVSFSIREGRLRVNDANVIANDIETSNGVIHVIDSVLLPPAGLQLAPQGRLVIGIYDERPSRALAEQLGLDRDGCLVITGIVDGSAAEKAGLKQYDIITSIGGQPASDARLKQAKQEVGLGGTIHLGLIRRGKPMTLDVEVGVARH